MTQLAIALAWAWVQTCLIAAVAITLSALALRKSPTAGASIAWAGVLASLVLTLIAPFPLPRAPLHLVPGRGTVPSEFMAPADQTVRSAARPITANDESSHGATLDLSLIHHLLAPIEQSQAAASNQARACRLVLATLATGIVFGLARVVHGIRAVASLRHRSKPIDDEILVTINHLQVTVGLRAPPQVRECSALTSAAAVGGWQPTILLPTDWRTWSATELKAVLAHELAHIARCDYTSRLAAALIVALQWTQPLAYWLRRQLIISQELAADDLAVSALGSRTEYLRALANLALRHDARATDGPVAALMPVFSGFLLRRIDMLRAKDCSLHRKPQPIMQWTAIALLALTAAATTALRSLAQPPEMQSDGSVRVAKAPVANAELATSTADPHMAAATLFQRPPFDPTSIAGKSGGFLVRLGEILKRSGFAEQVTALDNAFVEFWKDAFPAAEPLNWPLEEIDYIAGDFFFNVRTDPKPTSEHSNQVVFGAPSFVVRWQRPLHGQFESLLRIPGATQKSHEGTVYVELPIIPALGPTKMCVCRLDDHSLFAAQNETLFLSRLSKPSAPADAANWHKAWKNVDGGLLAFATTDANIVRPLGEPVDEEAKLYHDLFSHARVHAVGVDWQPNPDGATVAKVQFSFDTAEDASRLHNAIRAWTDRAADLMKAEASKPENVSGGKDEKAARALEAIVEALQKAKVDTRQGEDGWLVEMQISGPFDYRPLWRE
jgi:beta-lactamase regulating signal transducer with metallopeptidase domain